MEPWRTLCLDCDRAEFGAANSVHRMRVAMANPFERERLTSGTFEIYCVEAAGQSAYKFGIALSAEARLGGIQTGSPVLLTLVGYVLGRRSLEPLIHKVMAAHRVHGEWFRPDPPVLALVEGFRLRSTEVIGPLLGISPHSGHFVRLARGMTSIT